MNLKPSQVIILARSQVCEIVNELSWANKGLRVFFICQLFLNFPSLKWKENLNQTSRVKVIAKQRHISVGNLEHEDLEESKRTSIFIIMMPFGLSVGGLGNNNSWVGTWVGPFTFPHLQNEGLILCDFWVPCWVQNSVLRTSALWNILLCPVS